MRRACVALAVMALLATAAPAQARVTTIADGTAVTGLTAHAGHVVWSERNRQSLRWRLMHWHAGRVAPLAVQSRRAPFDADAGTDAVGRPVVTFSRCTQEPRDPNAWLTARGCHVEQVRLDAAGARPAVVPGTDTPGVSATTPSMWRGAVAFARHADGQFVSELILLRPGAEPTVLPGPPIACQVDCDDRRIELTIESLDLGERAAAFVSRQSGGDTIGIGPEWTLQTDPLDGSAPTALSGGFVDGACGFVYPLAPTVSGLGATWIAAGSPCDVTETALAEVDPSTGRRRVARPGLIFDAARDGAVTYWLRVAPANDDFPGSTRSCLSRKALCRIQRATGLRWRTVPRGAPLGPVPEDA